MIGLLLKLWLFIFGLVLIALVILNLTGVFKPGTISLHKPDAAPCQRLAAADKNHPRVVEVRWLWNAKSYGWGCYFEYDISDSRSITPMPK
jgi:hypothetical protein